MNVKLIPENREMGIIYIARVSNPGNQDNPDIAGLIRYLIRHGHWSPFEHSHFTLEINTSLAIATQILRHRSFTFQQFSQRYADPLQEGLAMEHFSLRKQAPKNRQSSQELLPMADTVLGERTIARAWDAATDAYRKLLDLGVAKELARMVLPQMTQTRLYMTGNVRSWLHYIALRTSPGTQEEHRRIAETARLIFTDLYPITAQAAIEEGLWTEPRSWS